LAGAAVEVFALQYWGTEFLVPISANIDGINAADYIGTTNPYEYAVYSVMAGFDETQVTYDGNHHRAVAGGEHPNRSSRSSNSLTSNRPIQVDLIGGDVGSSTSFVGMPRYRPPTLRMNTFASGGNSRAGFWFYNPGTDVITVNYEGGKHLRPGGASLLQVVHRSLSK
jgi:hypothetical protein